MTNLIATSPRIRQRGLTLIELMITVAIVGILASVAYPSYESYVRKSRRSAAQQAMLEISSKQEQYLLDARSYTTTLGSSGLNVSPSGWNCMTVTTQCSNTYYVITVAVTAASVASGPPTYTITATAQGAQVADGGLITLNNVGVKSPASLWK